MKLITKHFDTLKQAERFQANLYNKYNKVFLFEFPVISERGHYKWQVSV